MDKTKGAKSSGKKKKAGPVAKSEVLWTVKLEQKWKEASSKLKEIGAGVRSPDVPTRKMAILFILSVSALCFVLGASVQRYIHYRHMLKDVPSESDEGAKHLGEFLSKQSAEAKTRFTTLSLGTFSVELKPPTSGPAAAPGVMNLADLELFAECDTKETRYYIEDNLPQARNQLTNVLTAIDREELLSKDGKKKLVKAMLEKINLWLPKGKVENLRFNNLIVN